MLRSLPAFLCGILVALPALAGPTDPVLVEPAPEDLGAIFSPGVRLVSDLAEEYVEEEYFVSGAATLFSYAHNPPAGPTDLDPIAEAAPYKTRIIVRRPVHRGRFNGSLVIEWWNSTAGFDTAPVWDPSAEYFAREGYVYVGVTNSTTSINHLVNGCSLFPPFLPETCGTRYASLSLPENGLAYEMASQIANLLKSDSPENPLPREFRPDRIYHSGQSQQGGSLITYASAFHFPVNDGYFVQANIGARRINDGTPCGDPGADPFPDCTPELQGADALVRTDLPVPVVQALTETDVAFLFGVGGRQADTELYRYYETAGTAHLTVHKNTEVLPAGILGPDPLLLEDFCAYPMNTLADGPVFGSYLYNAMWENLDQQVRRGTPPPPGVVLETVGGVVQRDFFSNAKGGVRLPQLDVRIARYLPTNSVSPSIPPFLAQLAGLACILSGRVVPLIPEVIDLLYPSHGSYVNQIVRRTNDLVKAGFLLPQDAAKLKTAAARSSIP